MYPQYITLNGRSKDITGERFGRLVVIGPVAKNHRNQIVWLCNCDCGNTTHVIYAHLNAGFIRSCGCWKVDVTTARNTTHGSSHERLYKIWAGIVKRCVNPNAIGFKHYGGRGIAVCDVWRHSYETFRDHVSALPHYGEKGYSIDRINNDGNYEPDNVRWATSSTQHRNTRRNAVYTYGGKTQDVHSWADEFGIKPGTLRGRLARGHSLEVALTTPLGELR